MKNEEKRLGYGFSCGKANVALEADGYYVWDRRVIAAKNSYYMSA